MQGKNEADLRRVIEINALTGMTLGMIISVCFHLYYGNWDAFTTNRILLLKQMIGSGIYGAVVFGSTAVYDIEHWSLLRATITHYLITLISYLTANYLLGWFGTGKVFLISLLIFTVTYAAIWVFQTLRYKKELSNMNGLLNKRKARGSEDRITDEDFTVDVTFQDSYSFICEGTVIRSDGTAAADSTAQAMYEVRADNGVEYLASWSYHSALAPGTRVQLIQSSEGRYSLEQILG